MDDAKIGVLLWAPIESVETVKDELDRVGADLGWTFEYAQANGSPDTARSAAQTLLQKGVDGIVNIAVDNQALTSVINQAQSKDVPFVSQFVGPTDGVVDVSPATSVDTAKIAEKFLDDIGREGQIAVISTNTIPVLADRRDLFKKYIEENAPNVEIVEDYELQFDPSPIIDARNATTAFLSEHPDLKGVWTSFDDPGAGAALAVEQAGKAGDVVVTGYDGDSVFTEKMGPNGAATATVRHNYPGLSEQTLWAINELMKGNYVPRGIWFEDSILTADNLDQIDDLVGEGVVSCADLTDEKEKTTCSEAVNVNGDTVPVPKKDQ